MARAILVFLALALGLAGADSPEVRTRRVLDLILTRQYEIVYALFSPEMRQAITLDTYREQLAQIEALGKPEIGESESKPAGPFVVVAIPLRWPAAALQFSVTWTSEGRIAGTFFRVPPPPPATTRPPYSQPDAFTDRQVTIGTDQWKLPATLSVPAGKGPFPALVLVHGSGPHDRDETIGPNRPFRDLAEGLASRGVAVLRYEKRTKTYPALCAADSDFTMTDETVEDAVRAAALLRDAPGIDPKRIFVLGHSQGGYMMPRILRRDPRLAGGIVMAGNARPIETLIVEQLEYLSGLPGAAEGQRKALETARRDPWKLLPVPGPYRKDLENYDPAAEMAGISKPLLFLQGERDYQVTLADLKMWRAALGARSAATFRTYPDLNHLFMPGAGKATPAEYDRAGFVDEKIVRDIDTWIRGIR